MSTRNEKWDEEGSRGVLRWGQAVSDIEKTSGELTHACFRIMILTVT